VARIARVVVAPGNATVTRATSAGAEAIPIRRAGRFDDLAAQLGDQLGVPAEVHESGLPVPGDGSLVVCRPDVLYDLTRSRPETLPWVVGVDLLRNHVLDQSELHSLAAGVNSLDYGAWVYGEGKEPAIYGRLDVAEAIGAAVSDEPSDVGARYGRLTRPGDGDLPTLLATYLAALDPRLP
jgi:hypothetical protein